MSTEGESTGHDSIVGEFMEKMTRKLAAMMVAGGESKGTDEQSPHDAACGKTTACILKLAATTGKCVAIMHGAPGAGKTLFINTIVASWRNPGEVVVCSADYFFMKENEDGEMVYQFNPRQLRSAHAACLKQFESAVADEGVKIVIVDNTNTKTKEFKAYLSALPTVSVVFRVNPDDVINANEKLPKKDTVVSDTYRVFNVPVYIQ